MSSRLSSERGAILMHVAVASVVVIAFSMFVVDYGILWVSRNQAQNAADAGALAGAVAMAFDDDDRTDTGPAKQAALEVARLNGVFGEQPDVQIAMDDIIFFGEDPTKFPAECADDTCIRVDVYRNQLRGNALPIWFGQLVGLDDQGVRATAIARASVANASDCLKPFGIPDKWLDNHDDPQDGMWTPDDFFETTVGDTQNGPDDPTPLPDADVYVPPYDYGTLQANDNWTGYRASGTPNDIGVRVTLKSGNPQDALAPGFFYPVRLPLPAGEVSSGGDDYRENISQCNGVPVAIGDTLLNEPGDMIGPTFQGMADLIALDPDAEWDDATDTVINSCAQDEANPCAVRSPRIVAIPVFDTQVYHDLRNGSGLTELRIANILGFFMEEQVGNEVTGVITTIPGLTVDGGPTLPDGAGFLYSIQLVR